MVTHYGSSTGGAGAISAYATLDGSRLWSTSAVGVAPQVALANGRVYALRQTPTAVSLVALSATTGALVYETVLPVISLSGQSLDVVLGKDVIYAAVGHELFALEAAGGQVLSSTSSGSGQLLELALGRDRVYALNCADATRQFCDLLSFGL